MAGQALKSAPAIGIAGQFLDDIQVDFLMPPDSSGPSVNPVERPAT